MVKIFVGNLPREADQEEIKALFTEYGTVTECAIIKNYAFVHMDDRKDATKAIKNLHLYKLHGTPGLLSTFTAQHLTHATVMGLKMNSKELMVSEQHELGSDGPVVKRRWIDW
ncbi:hypothetical protein EPR50_G00199110 [Perca flavescens]|uniref:RRM domain-containing protein n=1 Tax=Perca flavescens TaxID=8167 RepID=A0A484C7I8_PERFV|nr:hypothetical protein EPR50_G00199110 [Perca flavescens]